MGAVLSMIQSIIDYNVEVISEKIQAKYNFTTTQIQNAIAAWLAIHPNLVSILSTAQLNKGKNIISLMDWLKNPYNFDTLLNDIQILQQRIPDEYDNIFKNKLRTLAESIQSLHKYVMSKRPGW